MLDYKQCPHRGDVRTTGNSEYAVCALVTAGIGGELTGVGLDLCQACAKAGEAFTFAGNEYLRRFRRHLLELPFTARIRIPTPRTNTTGAALAAVEAEGLRRRKRALVALAETDGESAERLMEFVNEAAKRGTIKADEIDELVTTIEATTTR